MKNKVLLIYITEKNEVMNLSYIGVSIASNFQLKSIFGLYIPPYTIDLNFKKQFSKNNLGDLNKVNDYHADIIKELDKYEYSNCNVIINLDLSYTFEGYILLPNLSGKSLNDSLNQELHSIYGSFLDSYDCEIIDSNYEGTLRKINIGFINSIQYKMLLDFLSINDYYKISRVNYTRDSFNNMFLLNKMKNIPTIGVFIDNENINVAIYDGNQTICNKCIDFGFNNLFNFINDDISVNDEYYDKIIEGIVAMMYSIRQNIDISTLLIIAPTYDRCDLKNKLIEKFSQFMDNPKYVDTDVECNYLVDMAIVKNRNIRKLPLRVKI